MNKVVALLLIVCWCALASAASVAPEAKKVRSVPASYPYNSVDLTGTWLGDYDASDDTEFLKIDVTQDSYGNVVGVFDDSGETTFNVTLTADQKAAVGLGFLFQGDQECGNVGAAANVWDSNHFSFAWGPGSPCGSFYAGQTGEFFRDLGDC